MARTPYSAPVPSPAGLMRLILLWSLLLDFPCATPTSPIALDLFVWMFAVNFCSWLKNSLSSCIEWRNEDVSCCQSCEQALWLTKWWAPRKMQSMLYFPVYCGDASVLHHPVPWNGKGRSNGMLLPQEMHSLTLARLSRAYYSDHIPLSGPAAAARPLHDILEMLEPLWQQRTNKTDIWPVKFNVLLDKLQQHGQAFAKLKPDETNLFKINWFNQQEFLWNSDQGAPAWGCSARARAGRASQSMQIFHAVSRPMLFRKPHCGTSPLAPDAKQGQEANVPTRNSSLSWQFGETANVPTRQRSQKEFQKPTFPQGIPVWVGSLERYALQASILRTFRDHPVNPPNTTGNEMMCHSIPGLVSLQNQELVLSLLDMLIDWGSVLGKIGL